MNINDIKNIIINNAQSELNADLSAKEIYKLQLESEISMLKELHDIGMSRNYNSNAYANLLFYKAEELNKQLKSLTN